MGSLTGRSYRQSGICLLILSTSVVAKGCMNLMCGAILGFTSFKDGNFLRRYVFTSFGSWYWVYTVLMMVERHVGEYIGISKYLCLC